MIFFKYWYVLNLGTQYAKTNRPVLGERKLDFSMSVHAFAASKTSVDLNEFHRIWPTAYILYNHQNWKLKDCIKLTFVANKATITLTCIELLISLHDEWHLSACGFVTAWPTTTKYEINKTYQVQVFKSQSIKCYLIKSTMMPKLNFGPPFTPPQCVCDSDK